MDNVTKIAREIMELAKSLEGFYDVQINIMQQIGDTDIGTSMEHARFSAQAPVSIDRTESDQ